MVRVFQVTPNSLTTANSTGEDTRLVPIRGWWRISNSQAKNEEAGNR